jgi:superfamily II DNA or RNA helicase
VGPRVETDELGSGWDVDAASEQRVVLDLRGNDLVLVPPPDLRTLPLSDLLVRLVGPAEASGLERVALLDERHHVLRLIAMYFAPLKAALRQWAAYPVQVAFAERPPLADTPRLALEPRPYQREALVAWQAEGSRGVVVLPTGAGKTLVGAMAIMETGLATLVVVPTIDLLGQWRAALSEALRLAPDRIGVVGGGERRVESITAITYESAVLYPRLVNQFGLLIFDECHHLPAPSYRQIAEGAFTPVRLGLSATPERADQEHLALDRLIGPIVFRREPDHLTAGRYLAEYEVRRVDVELDPDERARYETTRARYRDFLRRRRLRIETPQDFQRKILWASARDPEARDAMLAWREARRLALNAPAKLERLEELFARHREERVLVFSEYNALVDEVSQRSCLPRITHKTPTEERRAILEGFRSGRYSKLVTGRVLNEGVDIPDCRVAIVVSGNATRREYIQRLGRILRPKVERAILYELVTGDTTEEAVAQRRAART